MNQKIKTYEFTITMRINASSEQIARDKVYNRLKKFERTDVIEIKEMEFRG